MGDKASYLTVTFMLFVLISSLSCSVKADVRKGSELTVVEEQDGDNIDVEASVEDEDIDPDAEVFVPTTQWQTIKKGQSIPQGLHVRLNLETGVREAKLMTGDEDNEQDTSSEDRLSDMKNDLKEFTKGENQNSQESLKYWTQGDRAGMANLDKDSFTRDELKEALKKFKANADDVQDVESLNIGTKKKFRSMEDIRKEFAKLDLGIKTDLEVLTDLVEKYRDSDLRDDDHVHILTELEYHVHQIDNGINFALMGGLELLIKDLNHTRQDIRREAAFVLGSASQSNPKVQIQAIEVGVMQQLIRMLSMETSRSVTNRVIYALSCLLRRFPFAQQTFLANGGMQALTQLFTVPNTEKQRVKAVTLISDLLTEREETELHVDIKKPDQFEKLQQYKRVAVREAVVEHGWCDHIPSLLNLAEHDVREKVLVAMAISMDSCRPAFRRYQPLLTSLETEYSELSRGELQEGEKDGYFSKLLNSLRKISQGIEFKDEL